MLTYSIALEDDDGTLLATSPDFPELTTFGIHREDALARAADALEEAIAARIHDGRDIPSPSQGRQVAVLPTLTAVKVMLYQGMREQGIGKAELARRLGWHLPQVDRILDGSPQLANGSGGRSNGSHRPPPACQGSSPTLA